MPDVGDAVTAPTPGVQSVDRALDMLEVLSAARTPMGVTEVALATGLPPGTAHRLLRALQSRGFVRHDTARKYSLGAAALRLGETAQRSIASCARPHLARLVVLTGETANLAVLEGDHVVYIAQESSPHMLRMFAEVGRRVAPHSTAVGKVLLAEQPRARTVALLGRTGMPSLTERTLTTPEEFWVELDQVVRHGYAIDNGEHDLGVRCLAVPISDGRSVVAAVSVSGPAERLDPGRDRQLLEHINDVRGTLTRDLQS